MKELLKNLAKAKKEIGAISKDSKNPFFKSKYFDINQLLEHVEPILLKHGMILLQPISENKVFSVLYHIESGEETCSSLELPSIQDPQKIGSAISYYRRYTLTSLLAIQAEDDDGNKASKPTPIKPVTKTELTKEGFEYLIDKGTILQIQKAIKERDISTDYLKQLKEKLAK